MHKSFYNSEEKEGKKDDNCYLLYVDWHQVTSLALQVTIERCNIDQREKLANHYPKLCESSQGHSY